MSFPKSKILSPTAATSVSHNVKQETNVNINLTERAISSAAPQERAAVSAINPVANPTALGREPPSRETAETGTQTVAQTVDTQKTVEKVETPTAPNPYAEQITQLQSCVNFLKQVVHLIQSNPLIVSAVVIATQQDLINLIPLLIDNCTNVDIKIDEDSLLTCCQASQYAKIDRILVTVDGELKNLKYQYPDVYSTFQLYNISLKLVRID